MADLYDLSAAEGARRIRSGAVSSVDLLKSLLERIDAVEPSVRAWVELDRDRAREVARECDAEARAARWRGPLHGVPFAVKDIFDSACWPTTAGAGAFARHAPTNDAAPVARLRAAGAIGLGAVTTTAFAFLDPTRTCNPWNRAHTPGGSSSGPAAAVAARMAPLALGTQTVGSTVRPAAYCGVVGFKPSHGRISAAGMRPLAANLDHVGIFARRVEDCALALQITAGFDQADPLSSQAPVDEYVGGLTELAPPRIGVLREMLERAEPAIAAHLDSAARTLAAAGAVVSDVGLPASFVGLHEAGNIIVRAEAAAHHAQLFSQHRADYPPKIREAIEAGGLIRAVDYLSALRQRRAFRDDMVPVVSPYDALLLPAAAGSAPRGLDSTGDPYFCAPWSLAGMPALALPSGVGADGLPLALQLVGAAFAEARLLRAAAWCERVIGFTATPAL